MAVIWVLSDPHFSHTALLQGEPRPFESTTHMDEAMIANWNGVVRPEHHAYILGDVTMKRSALALVRRLNGHKRLIGGNHDIFALKDYLDAGFQKVGGVRVFGRDNSVVLTHVPVHPSALGRFRVNVHGHVHSKSLPDERYVNVSAEVVAYTPVNLDEILAWMDAPVRTQADIYFRPVWMRDFV
jgi:calcineurin-like phosphoesterase family protein